MLKKKKLRSLCRFLLLIPLFLSLSGCKVIQTIDSLNGILEEPAPDAETHTLSQAESAFFAGNYSLSEDLYVRILDTSNDARYINQAVYGLACLEIIRATNTRELKQGFVLLDQWQEPEMAVAGYGENPKMIAMAMASQAKLIKCESEIRYVAAQKDDELVDNYKKEIKDLKSTIEKLEHQISVLEAIDQEIQEKRKPI